MTDVTDVVVDNAIELFKFNVECRDLAMYKPQGANIGHTHS